ncbi:hypothetical protein COLO4_05708 [Corchorus olitorius]|uniref:RRM domain-containing protein n=1 Tax=Corchorus olitorius TaxID=93759 RepID=A0A1R3KQ49_9ROSI|nr:hypothetical protein COLO4_05708 [Corchorus olitorius]
MRAPQADWLENLVSTATELVRQLHKGSSITTATRPTIRRCSLWKPPPSGLVKINSDASYSVQDGVAHLGVVYRKAEGEVIVSASRKLDFVADSLYAEDYVIVLVSNGKCQSEVKADLEPFLGDSASDFVSWLWDILSETSDDDSNANLSPSDLETISGASSTEADASGKRRHSKKCGSGSTIQSHSPSLSNSSTDQETNEKASTDISSKSNKKFGAFENNQEYGSRTKSSADFLVADVQHGQYKKAQERSPLKYCQDSNVGGRRLFSKAAGAIFHQDKINGTKRGNVWDRLGKTSVKVKSNEGDNNKKQTAEQHSPRAGQITWMPTVQEGKVNQNLSWASNVKTCGSNGGQKRQSNNCIPILGSSSDSLHHEEENSRKYSRQPEQCTYMRTDDGASCKSEKLKSYNKRCTPEFDASVTSRPEKVSKKKMSLDASESTESTQTLLSQGALPSATGRIMPVQTELVDVKLRLQQLETQIHKLQSKPVNKGSFGLLKEGVESRTVCVKNVDSAATQDALRSYFAACGAISRVIKLSNQSTANKRWSAYITFASKESVNKALALNGTNFFSRMIWVRKAGKIATNQSFSQHSRGRKANFQQKRHHNRNLA